MLSSHQPGLHNSKETFLIFVYDLILGSSRRWLGGTLVKFSGGSVLKTLVCAEKTPGDKLTQSSCDEVGH